MGHDTAALYRALERAYTHPPTVHPCERSASATHPPEGSRRPATRAEQGRQQLHPLPADSPTAAHVWPAGQDHTATDSQSHTTPSDVRCSDRAAAGRPVASRLQQLAAAVRGGRRQPPVQGADLDCALSTNHHPLHEQARQLVARLKADCQLLQLPDGARPRSSSTGSVLGSVRHQRPLGSVLGAEYERARRRRIFSMLYK